MGRRGMRHTRLARHGAKRQARQAIAFEHPLGRLEQGVAQGAVMVRSIFARAGPRRASFPHRARGGDIACRAPDASPGNFGFSCHFRYIGHDFDSVKISLDGHRRALYSDLYDVKIT
jgi:hypothetical protein